MAAFAVYRCVHSHFFPQLKSDAASPSTTYISGKKKPTIRRKEESRLIVGTITGNEPTMVEDREPLLTASPPRTAPDTETVAVKYSSNQCAIAQLRFGPISPKPLQPPDFR